MMFGSLSVVLLSILFYIMTKRSYSRIREEVQRPSELPSAAGYLLWLGPAVGGFIMSLFKKSEQNEKNFWQSLPLSARNRRIITVLGLSFLYLSGSGLVFSWWPKHNLHGQFLVLHMILGGVFTAALTLAALLWSRFFLNVGGEGRESRPGLQRFLFWAFLLSGFVLILSALGMMIPLFSAAAQITLVELHRYAALSAVLSGVVLADRLFHGMHHAEQ